LDKLFCIRLEQFDFYMLIMLSYSVLNFYSWS